MCEINDPEHTCDKYLVVLVKSGMTIGASQTGLLSFVMKLRETYSSLLLT
jgi:hypothetical protein